MGCCCSKKETPVVHPVVRKERIPSVHEPVYFGQINDVGISTTDPSLLISGYEKEPLVSLEESLEPFEGHIQHLDSQIRQAKTHCHHPCDRHLTHDESAAIYLYSMRGDNNSVHEHLQRAWNTGDRSQMRPWFRYLRLLRSGLNKLPNTKGEVWQGTAYDPNLAKTLQSDGLPLYTCMGSSSTSLSDLKHDLNVKSGPGMILVGYKSIDGKDVTGYTESNSKEVFLWPGMKVNKGKNGEMDGFGAFTIHLTGRPNTIISEKTTMTPIPSVRSPKAKHFLCPMPTCRNQCGEDHAPNHCHGFSFLVHKCSHHCGPTLSCSRCGKNLTNLRECNKCHERFCDDCCMK